MSAKVLPMKPRNPIQARAAMELTDPTAIALNDMGQLFKAAAWMAARGYEILGSCTGRGRLYLTDGSTLRRPEQGPSLQVRARPRLFADLDAVNVGQYSGNDGTHLVFRGVNQAWPKVAIYWTQKQEGGTPCAA